ncbi:MAG: hypothetical protein AAFN10_21455 [Bacteroidota bacterium]
MLTIMRLFLVLVLGGLMSKLSGQNLQITDHAIWTYTPSSEEAPQNDVLDFPFINSLRDTIIEGQRANIVRPFTQWVANHPNQEAIVLYEQKQLFFREDEAWKLFCDFGLSVGDTMTYQLPRNQIAFDVHCGVEPEGNFRAQAVVDSISTVLVDNTAFQQLHFRAIESLDFNHWELGITTEILGSEYGFFGRSAEPCNLAYPGGLRCFQDKYCIDDPGYTMGYTVGDLMCYFIRVADGCGPSNFGLADIYPFENAIRISPTNSLELPLKIQVFDLSGKIVFEGLVRESEDFDIPTQTWTPNVYAVRILGRTDFRSKKIWVNP